MSGIYGRLEQLEKIQPSAPVSPSPLKAATQKKQAMTPPSFAPSVVQEPVFAKVMGIGPETSGSDSTTVFDADNLLASKHASVLASKRASRPSEQEVLKSVKKTLQRSGKEVLYVRLTAEEKQAVKDAVYAHVRQGIDVSDTDVGRIAVNFILEDYRAHGDDSVLVKLLAR